MLNELHKILMRINGISTPFFGISFEPAQTAHREKKRIVKKSQSRITYKDKQRTFNVTDAEPKRISLPIDLNNFKKISSKISLTNTTNARWRVGYRFIKESPRTREYVFHVFQDRNKNDFHSRIVELAGREIHPDILKMHLGVEHPHHFTLTLENNNNAMSFYVDGIFLGKYTVPLQDISELLISAWSHDNTEAIKVIFEETKIWTKEKDNAGTNSAKSKIPRETYSEWHEKWWIKYIILPLIVVLVSAYLIYVLGWNGNKADSINTQVSSTQSSTNKLRALETLETGKSIGDLPNGVYFFASSLAIRYELDDPDKDFLRASRNDSRGSFEVQKIRNRYYLIGYLSPEAHAKIGSISKDSIYTQLFPNVWDGATKTVAIPFDAIYTINEREIDLDENKSIDIFDIGFKDVSENPEIHKKEAL